MPASSSSSQDIGGFDLADHLRSAVICVTPDNPTNASGTVSLETAHGGTVVESTIDVQGGPDQVIPVSRTETQSFLRATVTLCAEGRRRPFLERRGHAGGAGQAHGSGRRVPARVVASSAGWRRSEIAGRETRWVSGGVGCRPRPRDRVPCGEYRAAGWGPARRSHERDDHALRHRSLRGQKAFHCPHAAAENAAMSLRSESRMAAWRVSLARSICESGSASMSYSFSVCSSPIRSIR